MASTLQEQQLTPEELLALYGIVPNRPKEMGGWTLKYGKSIETGNTSVVPRDSGGFYRGFDWGGWHPSWKSKRPEDYHAAFAIGVYMLVSDNEAFAHRTACRP